jgi:lipopolysaccharide transport system permease protein
VRLAASLGHRRQASQVSLFRRRPGRNELCIHSRFERLGLRSSFFMHSINKTIARLRIFFRYRELFFQLVSRDIKLKYRRSFLGYIWSVLNPLLTMTVLVIVFSNLFSRGVQHFPIYLLTGHLMFNFMSGSTSHSLLSVINNASLLKKIYVPKYIFTLASVTSELVTFFFSLGALLVVSFATGVPITGRYIFTLIPIVQLYFFCIGMGMFLAQATVFFRDVVYIWNVIITAWMYLSAIFYPVTILPEKLHYLVTHFNPMYFYITMFRNFTIGSAGMGSLDLAVRGAVAAGLMLFVGFVSFTFSKNKFILYI